jgi:hypothetical protein
MSEYSKSFYNVHTSRYGKFVGRSFILLEESDNSSRQFAPGFSLTRNSVASLVSRGMNLMNQKQLGNFWVFRDGRKTVNGRSMLEKLLRALDDLSLDHSSNERILCALVLAGQFESALADIGCSGLPTIQRATDFLADLLLRSDVRSVEAAAIKPRITGIHVPEQLTISPPEGFAYYALHPCDFARLAESVPPPSGRAAVIGIRSIGTTLSAVVSASLRHQGQAAERITVRPAGHPYNRVTEFSPDQCDWICRQLDQDVHFLVVDEGPGRSGSSFLSVAEGLMKAGVRSERITLLGSRPVDPSALCADEAATRWSQFHFLSPVMQTYERFKNDFYVGGGEWRNFLHSNSNWPESWPQMERLKFLSADRTCLFKFEGFGQFGRNVLERASVLSQAGLGPHAEDAGDGIISYSVIQGARPTSSDISSELLQHIAEYCAFRAREFSWHEPVSSQLGEMTQFNLQSQFGSAADFSPELLQTANPVLVDGRMQPHEWVLRNQKLIKVDATTHGDDHFFPGPTDIAWDLAGTIVEWSLDQSATDFLLQRFQQVSGDDVRSRIDHFVLAYTIFRLGYCSMALTTVKGTSEEARLTAARERYERGVLSRLANPHADTPLPAISIPSSQPSALPVSEA